MRVGKPECCMWHLRLDVCALFKCSMNTSDYLLASLCSGLAKMSACDLAAIAVIKVGEEKEEDAYFSAAHFIARPHVESSV